MKLKSALSISIARLMATVAETSINPASFRAADIWKSGSDLTTL